MNYEYGITREPANYNISSNNYEMGWLFTVNQDCYFYGFRVKAPNNVSKTCRLWNQNNIEIAQATVTSVGGQWVEVLLDDSIFLEAGKNYTISMWTDASYYCMQSASSNFSFNSKITFRNGKAGTTRNAYPSNYTEATIYPMIDCLLSSVPMRTFKFLISDGTNLYTVVDGEKTMIEGGSLDSATFTTYGLEEVPEWSVYSDIDDPLIYKWSEDEEPFVFLATETAIPPLQILVSPDYDMTHETILGIENVEVVASSDVMFAVSFDEGTTWKMYDGTQWIVLTQSSSGMSASTVNGITTEQWNSVAITGKFRFRIVIPDETETFTSLVVNYIN